MGEVYRQSNGLLGVRPAAGPPLTDLDLATARRIADALDRARADGFAEGCRAQGAVNGPHLDCTCWVGRREAEQLA